jgi:prepilin-type N-terminal cleavage/methylation domain-containing protein
MKRNGISNLRAALQRRTVRLSAEFRRASEPGEVAFDVQSSMFGVRCSSPRLRVHKTAFTLIEMLVVIAIISILAGLIVTGASMAIGKGKVSRVQAERDALVTAIQSYKKQMGYYPPDNPNDNRFSSLFYELTGTTNFQKAGITFLSPYTGEHLTAINITNLFGVGGFMNSSPDINNIYNFDPAVAKQGGKARDAGSLLSGSCAQFTVSGSPGLTFTVFGVPVNGLDVTNALNGKQMNLWHYVSTNPTNNSDSYDLWMDIKYSGKTNRISNWSPDPQRL